MKKRLIYIGISILSLLLITGLALEINSGMNSASKVGKLKEQKQTEWININENIESTNRLISVIGELYEEKTNDTTIYSKIKNTSENRVIKKEEIISNYKNNLTLLEQIETNLSPTILSENKTLSESILKANQLQETVKEELTLYNNHVKEYNSLISKPLSKILLNETKKEKILSI